MGGVKKLEVFMDIWREYSWYIMEIGWSWSERGVGEIAAERATTAAASECWAGVGVEGRSLYDNIEGWCSLGGDSRGVYRNRFTPAGGFTVGFNFDPIGLVQLKLCY